MEQVKVLGAGISPFAMRVLIALEEQGVKYEYQDEDIFSNKSELLLQMNPVYKKVPVLVHNGNPVCECLIILQYIDETWGSDKSSPYDRAVDRFWADFVDKKFVDSVSRFVKSRNEAQEEAKRDLLENLHVLEGALQKMSAGGSLPFFGGNDFGFVDTAIIPFCSWFYGIETIGNFKIRFESEYPLFNVWVKRCMERENVKKILPSSALVLERIRKRFIVD